MSRTSECPDDQCPHSRLVLYRARCDQESDEAQELLNEAGLHHQVVNLAEPDEETIVPWLSTPTSFFFGLDRIAGFVNHYKRRQDSDHIQ